MPNPPSPIAPLTFCGRHFSISDVEMIQEVAAPCSALRLTEMARTLGELLDWKRPNGKLKNHACRLLLERLRDQGQVRWPAVQLCGSRGPRPAPLTGRSDPQLAITGSAGQLEPLRLSGVGGERKADCQLWAQYVERYHYLGHRGPVGASLRYFVHSPHYPEPGLACLLWSSAAWKMAVRDHGMGGSPEPRARKLPFIVNPSRFLLLPWVRVQGLASKSLGHGARQLPDEGERRYGYRPRLLETLVEAEPFHGTCYRAANWLALGRTPGRGRMGREHRSALRPQLVFVYPLCRNIQQRLGQATAPA